MSANQKISSAITQTADVSILDQILDQVQTLSHQHQRPSPIRLNSWSEIERFAEKAAFSGLVPNDYKGKADAICIAIQFGSELGLSPMQSLINIAVISGRPTIWGDAMAALCRASGKLHYIKEWVEGTGDDKAWYCEALRKDDPNPIQQSFSVRQAKSAKLWGKAGPWTEYTDRMGQMRARSFCLRDACPDVLKGLIAREEAQDIPFDATGLQPTQPGHTAESAPVQPKKTVGWWIETAFPAILAQCETHGDLEKVQSKPAYIAACDRGSDEDRTKIGEMILTAMARIEIATSAAVDPEAPTEDDVFLGDR